MDTSTIDTLSTALDFGSARLQTISNNLSNISTPGYKRKDVSFQAMLDAANGDDAGVGMTQTDPRDLSLDGSSAQPTPDIVTQTDGAMRPDGNNVDVDAESARLASAQIYYSGAAQMIKGRFSEMKYAVSGGE
jgi:flagellar basal-body rod protein FlgB